MRTKTYRYSTVILLALTLIAPLLLSACAKSAGKSAGAGVNDATITARVKTSLINDPGVGALKIDVDTYSGVVTLSGAVKSVAERDKAVELARKIPGVKDVKTTLQIQP